jgi:hypothetical protein
MLFEGISAGCSGRAAKEHHAQHHDQRAGSLYLPGEGAHNQPNSINQDARAVLLMSPMHIIIISGQAVSIFQVREHIINHN